jgi:hypothetical protein
MLLLLFVLCFYTSLSSKINCKNCIFYEPVKIRVLNTQIIRGKCLKSGKLNIYNEKNKNATFEYTDICRRKNGFCGPEANYFVDKDIIHIGK